MSKLVTSKDLDFKHCAVPGCEEEHGPLFFHARCHPAGRIEAMYQRGGTLTIRCMECENDIARIAVAKEVEA